MNAGIVHLYPSIHPIRPSVHPSIRPLPTHARTYPQFIIYRFAFKYSSDSFPTLHIPHVWLTYQLIVGRFVHYFFMSLFICSFPLFHENEFLGSIIGLLSQTCLLALLLTYTHSFLLGLELAGAMRSHSIKKLSELQLKVVVFLFFFQHLQEMWRKGFQQTKN